MKVYPQWDLCTDINPDPPKRGDLGVYSPKRGNLGGGGSWYRYKGNSKMDVHEFEPESLKVKYYYSVDNSAMN